MVLSGPRPSGLCSVFAILDNCIRSVPGSFLVVGCNCRTYILTVCVPLASSNPLAWADVLRDLEYFWGSASVKVVLRSRYMRAITNRMTGGPRLCNCPTPFEYMYLYFSEVSHTPIEHVITQCEGIVFQLITLLHHRISENLLLMSLAG